MILLVVNIKLLCLCKFFKAGSNGSYLNNGNMKEMIKICWRTIDTMQRYHDFYHNITLLRRQLTIFRIKLWSTCPSSAISRVSSRLPIRVIVSSAMSVMLEKIASNSWLVVRSSWSWWWLMARTARTSPFVFALWRPLWSCGDLWGRTSLRGSGLWPPHRMSSHFFLFPHLSNILTDTEQYRTTVAMLEISFEIQHSHHIILFLHLIAN